MFVCLMSVCYITDNGGKRNKGSSNYPLRGEKADRWEGGVRVPAFVHSMLLNKEMIGSVFKGLMHVTDWFPTLVRVAGGSINSTKPLDGFDQWDSLKQVLFYISNIKTTLRLKKKI